MNKLTSHKVLWSFLGVFIFLLMLERPGTHLFDPDEARYAEIPREMLASKDFVTPTLNGSHYFEKPPLLYWLNAASLSLLGETPFAARLPTRLAALGTILLLIVMEGSSSQIVIGLWAALIYISAPLPFALGRINLTDGILSFFLTLTFLCLKKLLIEKNSSRGRQALSVGLGAGLGLAMLSKGLIAVVLPGAVVFLWVLFLNEWKSLSKLLLSWALPVFFLITIPWFVLVERANPGFSKFFFIHEHFQRFATDSAKRVEPFYFFALVFVAGFLPWLGLLGRSLVKLGTRLREEATLLADEIFLVLWMGAVFVFFSASHSKLIPYILPMFPPAAILAAHQISSLRPGLKKLCLIQTGIWALVWLIAIIALPAVAKRYSDHDLALEAQQSGADRIVCFKTYSQNFPWTLKRNVPVVEYQGELASDQKKSSDLFWSEEDLWKVWYSDEKVAVCLRKGDWDGFKASSSNGVVTLAENRRSLLVANFNPHLNK